MKLSPGDTIQLIVTLGGVPYAKTMSASKFIAGGLDEAVLAAARLLSEDVDRYADEASD
jgi:hypothetical protein